MPRWAWQNLKTKAHLSVTLSATLEILVILVSEIKLFVRTEKGRLSKLDRLLGLFGDVLGVISASLVLFKDLWNSMKSSNCFMYSIAKSSILASSCNCDLRATHVENDNFMCSEY